MKKIISVAVLILSVLVFPALSFAQTTGDVPPSGTPSSCLQIQNNLQYRSRDAATNGEVSAFQDFLQTKGFLNSEPTGYFGLLTLQAAKSFQTTVGLSSTGYVGPLTRAAIAASSCANGVVPLGPAVQAGCPTGAVYNNTTGAPCTTTTPPITPGCPDGAMFNSMTGKPCNPTTTSSLNVIFPNAGANLQEGNSYTASWTASPVDLDDYQVMTGNNLVPGWLSGSPVYTPVYTNSVNYSVSPSIVKEFMANSSGKYSEADIRRNFYIIVRAYNGVSSGKDGQIVAEGRSGTFIIASPAILTEGGCSTGAMYNSITGKPCAPTNPPISTSQPTITSIFPAAIARGALATITGQNFNTNSANTITLKNISTGQIYTQGLRSNDGRTLPFLVPMMATAGSYTVVVDNNLNVATTQGYPILVTSDSASIQMTSPQAGVQWVKGSTYPVTWSAQNMTGNVAINLIDYTPGSRFGLQYGITNGSNVLADANQKTFNWTIPSNIPAGSNYKAVVGMGEVNSFSELFSIVEPNTTTQPSLNVTAPSSGQAIKSGQTNTITWNSTGMSASDMVTINLNYSPIGYTYNRIQDTIAQNVPNTGSYNWVPSEFYTSGIVPGSFSISIQAARASGASNGSFSIVSGQVAPQFSVVTPQGGESIVAGSDAAFALNVPTIGKALGVTLLKKNDTSFARWVQVYYMNPTNSWMWRVPADIGVGDYYLKISLSSDVSRGSVAYSNSFSVTNLSTAQSPHIDSVNPNSGSVGTITSITGSGFTGSQVKIDGLVVGSSYYNIMNANSITLTVPSSVGPGQSCPPGGMCPDYLLPIGPGAHSVQVVNSAGSSNTGTFNVVIK